MKKKVHWAMLEDIRKYAANVFDLNDFEEVSDAKEEGLTLTN